MSDDAKTLKRYYKQYSIQADKILTASNEKKYSFKSTESHISRIHTWKASTTAQNFYYKLGVLFLFHKTYFFIENRIYFETYFKTYFILHHVSRGAFIKST